QAARTAARRLVDANLRQHPEQARDLLALLDGVHLTDEQARVLGDLVGVDLSRREPRLQNHVLLPQLEDGSLQVHTVPSSELVPPAGLTAARLRGLLGKSGRAVVQGPVDENLARELNAAGVYFFRDAEIFRRDPLPALERRVRLIMVAATGRT